MKEIVPAAMVASAEQDERLGARLPGIGEFVQSLKTDIAASRRMSAVAEVENWAVARALFEYGASDAVQEAIEKINSAEGRTGRKKLGYRLAMEELAASGAASLKTLERWVSRWKRAAETLQVCPGCTAQEFSLTVRENSEGLVPLVERLTMTEEPAPAAKVDPTPEVLAESFCKFVTENLKSKAVRDAIIVKAKPALRKVGLELTPLGEAE